jgi:ABC-type transport system substrate-binding protein
MTSQLVIQEAIDSGLPLKFVGTPAFYEPLAFSLDKSRGPSDKMVAKLDEILDEMHADGTLTELSEEWYGFDITKRVSPEVVGEEGLMSVTAPDCDYGGKIKDITALDPLTVRFTMCKPDPAFLAKAAFTPFGIQPKEWIEETGGTGELLEHPIGTGPYKLDAWNRGESVVFKRFDDYWGDPAIAETVVFRWATEGAARLLELQSGNVDQITNVSPDDFETVEADPNLQLLPLFSPNVLYLAMTNTFEPFDDVNVRKAVAMGIDRERVVEFFYPEGSSVPTHFTPCSIPNGCAGDPWPDFDPEAARALLAEAGYPDGFETSIFYRDVFRSYLPEPSLVAVEFQAQLKENLGIDVNVVVMESGEFIDESTQGRLDGLYLLGWGADYPHVTNFLDFHFSASNPQFGDPHPEIYEVLEEASQIGDAAEAEALYVQANNAIRELVPMVPIAHGTAAEAALVDVKTHVRVFGAIVGARVDPGKDTFIHMQNNEPISLYCSDETDGESLLPCQQVVESLLAYAMDSGDTVPALATSCEPNEDSTVWTCTLREGVKFHDGSDFDATDVVASWATGIDAANPNHVGNTGAFEYFSYLWDGLMNADQ